MRTGKRCYIRVGERRRVRCSRRQPSVRHVGATRAGRAEPRHTAGGVASSDRCVSRATGIYVTLLLVCFLRDVTHELIVWFLTEMEL